jgi:hypothetical protein
MCPCLICIVAFVSCDLKSAFPTEHFMNFELTRIVIALITSFEKYELHGILMTFKNIHPHDIDREKWWSMVPASHILFSRSMCWFLWFVHQCVDCHVSSFFSCHIFLSVFLWDSYGHFLCHCLFGFCSIHLVWFDNTTKEAIEQLFWMWETSPEVFMIKRDHNGKPLHHGKTVAKHCLQSNTTIYFHVSLYSEVDW